MNAKTPFSYRAGDSILHRAPAAFKLLFLFIFSIGFFLVNNIQSLFIKSAVYFFYALLLLTFARILKTRILELLQGSKALFFMCAPVLIFKSLDFFPFLFSLGGLIDALFFWFSMLLSFTAGAVYFSCTKMNELKEALPNLLGLSISLTLHFIPRFFEIWEDSCDAWYSRGGKKGLRFFFMLIPSVVERMIESAAETADALRARNSW